MYWSVGGGLADRERHAVGRGVADAVGLARSDHWASCSSVSVTNSIAAPQLSVRSSSSFTISFADTGRSGGELTVVRQPAARAAAARANTSNTRVVCVDANAQVLDWPVAAEVVFAQEAEVVVRGVELLGRPVLVAFDRRDDAFEVLGGEGRRLGDGDVFAERTVEFGQQFGAVLVGGAKSPSGRRERRRRNLTADRGIASAGQRSSDRRP